MSLYILIYDKISIEELSQKSEYGSKLIESISNDLKQVLPNVKSFSSTNLKYMRQFYVLFNSERKMPQVGAELGDIPNLPQVGVKSNNRTNVPQVVAYDDFDNLLVFCIPWGIKGCD